MWRLVLGIVGVCLGLLPGCASERQQILPSRPTIVGPSQRIELDKPPPEDPRYYVRHENVTRLTGLVNGTTPFQFVLSATAGPRSGVELSAEDLTGSAGSIPRTAVRFYRQWPIVIERYPNWYLRSQGPRQRRQVLDVLVPINSPYHGQPFFIAAGSQLPIWAEIVVPPDTRPGAYQGGVVVRESGAAAVRLPIELLVRDIYLSPNDALPVMARVSLPPIIAAQTQVDPFNARLALSDEVARQALTRAFVVLHEHGLCPYTDEVRPLFDQDQDGAVQLDWSDYDAFCGPLIDGAAYEDTRRAYAWPLPVDLRQPEPAQYGGTRSAAFAAVLRDHLCQVREHFHETGWLDRAFVWFDLPGQDDPTAELVAEIRQLAAATHLADERLAFVSALAPQPMTAFGWSDHHFEDLSAEADIWATPARQQHPATIQRLQSLGKRTWLQPDRPPYSGSLAVEAPPVQARSLPWQAFLQRHEAVFLPHTTDWPADVLNAPIRDRGAPSDEWLVYPGKPFGLSDPVPSVRLKQLQQGVQDYQLLRLLAAKGRGATAGLLASSLIKAAGTDACGDNYQDGLYDRRIDDPQTWEQARAILVEETEAALLETSAPVSNAARIQAAWAEFLNATRRIDMWAESTRLSPDARPGQSGYLIAYELGIRSELRTPVYGELKFATLPPGAQRVSDLVRAGPLREMAVVRKQLVAATPQLVACDLDGHHMQTIVFDAGSSGSVQVEATLSVVQVPAVREPITVDADLRDWPPSEFNIAGDFRLITVGTTDDHLGRQPEPAVGQRPRAESQTVAYFCRHGDTLYIAMHAATPANGPDAASPGPLRNFVEYEELMPVGEDLIEIMIDPTNAGTQSDDLYHIVLKSTGNPVFERGIGMARPIGTRRPWPGDPPRCCVARTECGWCAEIAIPISAFGPEAAGNPIWGVNLARLEPIRGEYSDWARAPRYCYDPRTLGNLMWRR